MPLRTITSMRAVRFFFLYAIDFVLQAASALENTDGERFVNISAHYDKNSGNFRRSQMERFVSVCSNRNIRDHHLIGGTENYLSILTNRLISRFPSVDFSYIGNASQFHRTRNIVSRVSFCIQAANYANNENYQIMQEIRILRRSSKRLM